MKILITGSSGYLGGKLTKSLMDDGNKVDLLLRQSSIIPNAFESSEQVEIGRCNSDEEIFQFIKHSQPDLVIHTACCYGRSNEMYRDVTNANIDLGVSILGALKYIGKRASFINIGTALPSDVSFYALTKNQFTNFGEWFCENSQKKLQFINLVVEHFYGVGESEEKFISFLLNQCAANVEEINLTEGMQKRDFIYIDDLLGACKVVVNNLSEIAQFQSIPIGSGEALSIKELSLMIHRLTKSKSQLNFGAIPYRSNELMNSKADLSIIKSFGWIPRVNIEEGIIELINKNKFNSEFSL